MEDVKMTDITDIEDVKSPEAMMGINSPSPPGVITPPSPLQSTSSELESWIETLSKCHQLPEDDVKRLCDKVNPHWRIRLI
jgi:hypothetical protein